MSPAGRPCVSCQTPIPSGSLFCPICGTATPTGISLETGTAHAPDSVDRDEIEQRGRVQRALGPGFELGKLLGRGGFAEVYEATDLRLKRRVAVKALRGDLLVSSSLSERFRREAEAVAKLRHPNIVTIYQVGEGEGLSYYIMPLIEGGSLRERMEQGPLPIADVRRILRETASALAVAHEAGIVHRDIKPDNIMLDGREQRAMVMDFGIAKALSSGDSGLTGTGMIVGTPHYMSPEQAMGSKDIDERSDLYSLGVVAYQMLAGQLPFEGTSAQEVLVQHITGKPKPIDSVRPDAPTDLVDAVSRCLEKDVEKRWAHAEDLVNSLDTASPEPSGTRQRRGLRAMRFGRFKLRLRRWHVFASALLLAAVYLGYARRDVLSNAVTGWTEMLRSSEQQRFDPDIAFMTQRVFQVGDTAIGVLSAEHAGFGLAIWNGRGWSRPHVPEEWAEDFGWGSALVEVVQSADTVFFVFGNQERLYFLNGDRVEAGDSLPSWAAVWAAGRDMAVGTSEGEILFRTDSGWQLSPTGRATPITSIFGSSRDHLYAFGNEPDSVLRDRRIAWQAFDPRPDHSRRWSYRVGLAIEPRTTLLLGHDCSDDKGTDCLPLLALSDSQAGHWRTSRAAWPSHFFFEGALGLGDGRLLLWGGYSSVLPKGLSANSDADTSVFSCERYPCLWRTDGADHAEAVTELTGQFIVGAVLVRGRPLVVAGNGVVWSELQGTWGAVTQVPGGVALTAEWDTVRANGRRVSATRAAAGDGWISGFYEGPGSSSRAVYPYSQPVTFRRARARNGVLAYLTQDGRIALFDCRATPDASCRPVAVSPPPGMQVADIAILRPDTLLAVGSQGRIGLWSRGRWQTQTVDSSLDLIEVFAQDQSPLTVLARHSVIQRRSNGGWSVVRAFPNYQDLRHLAVLSDSSIAVTDQQYVVTADGAGCWVPSNQTISSIIPLGGERFMVASAPTRDPLAGGWVAVGSNRLGCGASRPVPSSVGIYLLHRSRGWVTTLVDGAATSIFSDGVEGFGSNGIRLFWPARNLPPGPPIARK
jgi:tRNA A-37 threonylcarbamoyl transferase component Bud32